VWDTFKVYISLLYKMIMQAWLYKLLILRNKVNFP